MNLSLFPEDAEDTVARRIVMRRGVWEQLVHVATALRETRGVEVTAIEVARIALEAGVSEMQRTASGKQRRPLTDSGRRRRSRQLNLTAEEDAELTALLDGVRSVRARQRTIALWLGHRRRIDVEWLRQLSGERSAYDVANFAQNMKKDSAFFRQRKNAEGKRLGWSLTRAGAREAQAIVSDLLTAV